MMGTIYLLHFEPAYKHAQHYLGYTERDVEDRLQDHQHGNGARLTQVASGAGVKLWVVRTWDNKTRDDERRLKNHNHEPRLCPICNPDGWERRGVL